MQSADALDGTYRAALQEKLKSLFNPRHFDIRTLDVAHGWSVR